MFDSYNPTEVAYKPSQPQQINYQRLIDIIRQKPGISINEICKQYYGESKASHKAMVSMLTQLCLDNKIKYQPINCYVVVDESPTMDRDRVEAKVLSLLNLEIIGLEDYCDECIPDNYPRWRLMRAGKWLADISRWNERYHTRLKPNKWGYLSLYAAATCWVDDNHLHLLEGMATGILQQQSQQSPEYF